MYGSAGLLSWPSVLVSVYLTEQNGAAWDEASIAESRETLAIAVDWIEAQCAAYHVDTAITCDDGTPDSGLFVHTTYNGSFAGGTGSDESDDFYAAVYDLCASLDTAELRQRYGTSSIGFLIFLPVDGASFTMVHYLETAPTITRVQLPVQGGRLHRPRRLRDAGGLRPLDPASVRRARPVRGSSDYYVTPELTDYVRGPGRTRSCWTPTPRRQPGLRAVEKQLGPLTAARLGLCTTFDGAEQFPAVLETPAGTFSTGELAAASACPTAWCRQTRLTPGTTTGTTKGRCAHAHGTGLSAAGGAGARRRL